MQWTVNQESKQYCSQQALPTTLPRRRRHPHAAAASAGRFALGALTLLLLPGKCTDITMKGAEQQLYMAGNIHTERDARVAACWAGRQLLDAESLVANTMTCPVARSLLLWACSLLGEALGAVVGLPPPLGAALGHYRVKIQLRVRRMIMRLRGGHRCVFL